MVMDMRHKYNYKFCKNQQLLKLKYYVHITLG